MPHEKHGCVQLVGAGPGAVDLLTLRALRAIEGANVILHDALVGDEILALIPAHVRLIEVGKRGHRVSTRQDFINRLMVRFAKAGLRVVRLKGGDPSVFGRAAEERDFVEARGVNVEVIPGITTASAAAAQFGFSLTARGKARRVLFATGRTLEGAAEAWRAAADPETTLCLYMGCADIETIAARLIAAGLDGETPAIAALDVSRRSASLVRTTLARMPAELSGVELGAPVFICIGAVTADAIKKNDAGLQEILTEAKGASR